jgi:UDP-glucose 4-epimerase
VSDKKLFISLVMHKIYNNAKLWRLVFESVNKPSKTYSNSICKIAREYVFKPVTDEQVFMKSFIYSSTLLIFAMTINTRNLSTLSQRSVVIIANTSYIVAVR